MAATRRLADKAEFKEEWVKRGGHTDNPGKFSEQGGPGKIVEPAETHEPVEKFKEPTKEPSPGGKALKEANKPVSPEAHEKNLKAAKASGDLAKVEQEKSLDKQHDQQLELVAAKGDPKAAAAKVAGKKPSKLGDAPEELNKEALSPDRLNEMSALPLFEGAGVPIKGSVTRKGGEVVSEGNYEPGDRTITEVADDLVQRGQAWLRDLGYPNGRVDSSNATPEVNDALATVIAEETKRALDAARPENPERSAANWYNTALDEAMNVAALTHPEIKTDPKAKTAFSAAMAITSSRRDGVLQRSPRRSGLRKLEEERRPFPHEGWRLQGQQAEDDAEQFRQVRRLDGHVWRRGWQGVSRKRDQRREIHAGAQGAAQAQGAADRLRHEERVQLQALWLGSVRAEDRQRLLPEPDRQLRAGDAGQMVPAHVRPHDRHAARREEERRSGERTARQVHRPAQAGRQGEQDRAAHRRFLSRRA